MATSEVIAPVLLTLYWPGPLGPSVNMDLRYTVIRYTVNSVSHKESKRLFHNLHPHIQGIDINDIPHEG